MNRISKTLLRFTRGTWRTSRPSRKVSATCVAISRLFATMFVKTGTAILGANWIILPIFGERMFRVGNDPASAGMLGMSLLMCSRGIGAMIGPLVAGRWSGHNEVRIRLGIVVAFALACIGLSDRVMGLVARCCMPRRCTGPFRRVDCMGVFYDVACRNTQMTNFEGVCSRRNLH